MAQKKTKKTRSTTTKRSRTRPAPKAAPAPRGKWEATLATLAEAEDVVEKQVRELLRKNKIGGKEARVFLQELGTKLDRQRRKAMVQLEGRAKTLQTRLRKERKAFGRAVEEAVHGTLAAFNIPSRQEVAQLTRRVEELSHKIDSLKR